MYQEYKNQLSKAVESYGKITDKEMSSFTEMLKPIFIKKDDYFIRTGETEPWLGFIVSGLFRGFQINESGEEYIKHFFRENDFMTANSRSLVDIDYVSQSSAYYFQALEDSVVLQINKVETRKLLKYICWVEMFSKFIEQVHRIEEDRIKHLMLDDATTRYLRFKENFPGLENRLKQFYIASYIGISPVSLSRIRAGLKSS
ncbi:MAG: Crp/Fnr family transcriptional regulator [Sporolactobacillus sp.]